MRTPFQPSAVCAAYAALPNIDDDARYDMARIAMIAGALPLARAEEIAISLKSFGAATKS